MMRSQLRMWRVIPYLLTLAGMLAACGEEPEAESAAIFGPDQATQDRAEEQLSSIGLPLEKVPPAALGDAVCRSLQRDESSEETRAVVREELDEIASATAARRPLSVDDEMADRVIAVFRGPYCDRIEVIRKS